MARLQGQRGGGIGKLLIFLLILVVLVLLYLYVIAPLFNLPGEINTLIGLATQSGFHT